MPGVTTSDPYARATDLAWALGGIEDPNELVTAAMSGVMELLDGDAAGFNEVAPGLRPEIARITPDSDRVADAPLVVAGVLDDHPVTRALQARPVAAPLRMSDLLPVERFRDTRTYEALFRPRGLLHQIVLPVRVDPAAGRATTYVVNRAQDDFADADVAMAGLLTPMLAGLHAAMEARRPSPEQREKARRRAGLTERELDVLSLMAGGMTAVAIARIRGISERTVRKHLENGYSKLGVHDRLQAVEHCRRRGLLP